MARGAGSSLLSRVFEENLFGLPDVKVCALLTELVHPEVRTPRQKLNHAVYAVQRRAGARALEKR